MSERAAFENLDRRIIEFQIRRGKLSKKEYEKYLASLSNDEGNADYIEVFEDGMSPASTSTSALTFVAAESNE